MRQITRQSTVSFPKRLALLALLVACGSSGDLASADFAPESAGPGGKGGSGGSGGDNTAGKGGAGGGPGAGGNAGASAGGSGGSGAAGMAGIAGMAGMAGSGGVNGDCLGCLHVMCEPDVTACEANTSCAGCLGPGGACLPGAALEQLAGCACKQCAEQCSGSDALMCKGAGGGAGNGGGAGSAGSGGGTSGNAGSAGTSAAGSAGASGSAGGPAEDCTDGVDNDKNGLVDCDDSDCTQACQDACLSPPLLTAGSSVKGTTKQHANQFAATCIMADETGPDVVYRVHADAAGLLRLKVDSAVDMALSVRGACGPGLADLACGDQSSAGGSEQLALPVNVGDELFVLVGGVGNVAGDFTLTAAIEAITCGDGVVSPTEECDDGNTSDADGCTNTCQLKACLETPAIDSIDLPDGAEMTGTTAGGTSAIQPSCAKLGGAAPAVVYKVRAAHAGRLEARLEPMDGADLGLSVRGSCQQGGSEKACVDAAGKGGVERLSTPVLPGQSVFIVVGGYDSQQKGAFKLRVRNVALTCGDGVVSSAEQCDVKQPDLPHPCTASCVLQLPDGNTEAEPNDTPAAKQALSGGAVLGSILPAKDVDVFRIDVAAPDAQLDARVDDRLDGGQPFGACAAEQLDSFLELLAPDGVTVLASNDDSDDDTTDGFCSALSVKGLAPGGYFLRVRASPTYARESVFSYRLVATVK